MQYLVAEILVVQTFDIMSKTIVLLYRTQSLQYQKIEHSDEKKMNISFFNIRFIKIETYRTTPFPENFCPAHPIFFILPVHSFNNIY